MKQNRTQKKNQMEQNRNKGNQMKQNKTDQMIITLL